ncbi:MAG: CoA-binding protein [Spirochaetia bacterium]|nr:CoA-binding protein [Spirochaetia bacterium]
MATTKKSIEDFLSVKRIAVIGMSRSKTEYSRMLMKEFSGAGYEIVPVNPAAKEIEGKMCFASVKDVTPVAERVIMLLPPDRAEQAMTECAEAGVKDVWMHSHLMKGVQNTKAIYQAEKNGINLITGFCPMMFIKNSMFKHRIHGGIMKLLGAYPK